MINWGIIGLGTIANTFASALKFVDNANLRAVASRSLTNAIEFRDKHKADVCYSNYKKLANDSDVNIIYIATPHVFHFEQAKMCLENGKAVLCEKPMGMNAKQVKELCVIAKKNNSLLMEGMWTAFLPNFSRLETIVKQKKYGAIKKLSADFCFIAPTNPNHRLINKSLGGGTLLDIGIYNIFACLRFLGAPNSIIAVTEISETGVDFHCDLKFVYENKIGHLISSFKKDSASSLRIEFEKAEAILTPNYFSPAALKILIDGKTELEFEKYSCASGYELEAKHFQQLYINQKLESPIMSHQNSIELANYLDIALKEAGISYKLID